MAHYKAYNGKVLQGEDTIKRHKMPKAKYSAFVLFVPFAASVNQQSVVRGFNAFGPEIQFLTI